MPDSFKDHFSTQSSSYAQFRPRYPTDLYEYLSSLVPAATTVWDCATGNGQAAQDLANRFGRVIATDASARQVAAALPHPGVDFRVATAERSGLPDASIGLITVAQALHWFDLSSFYSEARRVLVTGGILAVWAYGIQNVEDPQINEIVMDYYSRVVGSYWPPERQLVESGYRTIPFPFEELTPPSFQMQESWSLEQLLGYFSSWSATVRCLQATGRDPLQDLRHRLAEPWGDPAKPRRVLWPLALRVGRS